MAVMFERKKNVVTNVSDGTTKKFTYINEAKRCTREIVAKHGLGSVRTIRS